MDKFFPYMFGGVPPPMNTYTYYDSLIVVDFEATCDDAKTTGGEAAIRPLRSERQEIIQFPAVLIDVRQMTIVDQFDAYVKPVEKPVLSDFCTSLTGITQDMVDKASPFPKVLRKFERWLKKHGLSNSGNGRTFAIVADGSYDMGHFLYKQCLISNIPFPTYARRWVNIRTNFSKFYGQRWFSLKSVLEMMGQPFEGRQHNGLDDAKNIGKVLLRMLMDGCIIAQTEKIILDFEDQEKNEIRILNDKHAGKYDLATVKPVSCNECIYMLPPNVMFRQPPETDPISNYSLKFDNNKENFPTKSERKGNKGGSHEKRERRGKKKSSKSTEFPSACHGPLPSVMPARCMACNGIKPTVTVSASSTEDHGVPNHRHVQDEE